MNNINSFINFDTYQFPHSLLKVGIIIIVSIFIIKLASLFINRLIKLLEKGTITSDERIQLRTKTLAGVINGIFITDIVILTLILILDQIGINITPLIAGAGVLGIALSFGAQNLIKDLINGFFILLEDQYSIGDIIKIGAFSGTVECMSLRATILRDLSGNVHIIPNGEIKQVTIMTKLWAKAVVDIKIFHKQNIKKVFSTITEESFRLKDEWNDKIIEDPDILGVDSIAPDGITIKVTVKTKPGMQWGVERELRRRIIERFNMLGIEFSSIEQLGRI